MLYSRIRSVALHAILMQAQIGSRSRRRSNEHVEAMVQRMYRTWGSCGARPAQAAGPGRARIRTAAYTRRSPGAQFAQTPRSRRPPCLAAHSTSGLRRSARGDVQLHCAHWALTRRTGRTRRVAHGMMAAAAAATLQPSALLACTRPCSTSGQLDLFPWHISIGPR